MRPGHTMMDIRLDQHSQRQIADLYRKSKKVAHGGLAKEMRKRLRHGVLPALRLAKTRARNLPSRGHGTTGLRRRIARGIRIKVVLSRDARVQVVLPRKELTLPIHQQSLPGRGNRDGGWRHPVFGRDVWVRQDMPGWRGWFDHAMVEAAPGVRRELLTVLDEMERRMKV